MVVVACAKTSPEICCECLPQPANESPWPEPRSFTSSQAADAEIEASVRCRNRSIRCLRLRILRRLF